MQIVHSNPDGLPVWLESVIAVPTEDPENFDEGFLRPEKVDMSNDFLKECGNKNHFYLSPDVEGIINNELWGSIQGVAGSRVFWRLG